MNKLIYFFILIYSAFSSFALPQDTTTLKTSNKKIYDENKNYLYTETYYYFEINIDTSKYEKDEFKLINNWNVVNNKGNVKINNLYYDYPFLRIYIDKQGIEGLRIIYKNTKSRIAKLSNTLKNKLFDIGKGKEIDLDVRKMTEQKAIYAFDYSLGIKILDFHFIPKNHFSLDFDSKGTFGDDKSIKNGTITSLYTSYRLYYTLIGMMYKLEINPISFKLETKMDTINNKIFSVINKSVNFGFLAEIPYTNWLNKQILEISEYPRMPMPLIIGADYSLKGKDINNAETPSRIDIKGIYEIPLSGYLIIKTEYGWTHFFDVTNNGKNINYYSISFAQDLSMWNKCIPALNYIFPSSRGNNFIFYKIQNGKMPPSFQNINEQSLGFSFSF